MTSAEDARTFCEKAVAQRCIETFSDLGYWNERAIARAVLDLLLGAPGRPCPRCEGRGKFGYKTPEVDPLHTGRVVPDLCPDCRGTGIVAAVPPLRRPCPNPKCQGGHIQTWDPTVDGNVILMDCPDCSDGGFSSLAAIDEARGIRRTRIIEDCNVVYDDTGMLVPAPDRREQ